MDISDGFLTGFPEELIEYIALYLPLPSLINFSVACRAFWSILSKDTFWAAYVKSHISLRHSDEFIRTIPHWNQKPWRYYWRLRGRCQTDAGVIFNGGRGEKARTLPSCIFYSSQVYLTSNGELLWAHSHEAAVTLSNIAIVRLSFLSDKQLVCMLITTEGKIYIGNILTDAHLFQSGIVLSEISSNEASNAIFVDAAVFRMDNTHGVITSVVLAIDNNGRLFCTEQLSDANFIAIQGPQRVPVDTKQRYIPRAGADGQSGADGASGRPWPQLPPVTKALSLAHNSRYLAIKTRDVNQQYVALVRNDGNIVIGKLEVGQSVRLDLLYVLQCERPVVSLAYGEETGYNLYRGFLSDETKYKLYLVIEDYSQHNFFSVDITNNNSIQAYKTLTGIRRCCCKNSKVYITTQRGQIYRNPSAKYVNSAMSTSLTEGGKFRALEADFDTAQGIVYHECLIETMLTDEIPTSVSEQAVSAQIDNSCTLI